MGIAAIPIIFTITEDALTAVPKSFYEASLALGASKWQTAFFVILPAATPGIFAAILLGIGRVFGETMIALMATGNAAQMDLNPFTSVRTLAATIGAEMAEVVFGDTHYNVLFLIGSLLFIFTFIINAVAIARIKVELDRRRHLAAELEAMRKTLRAVAGQLPACPVCGQLHQREVPAGEAGRLSSPIIAELADAICPACRSGNS